jgi:hypothetical protein
VKEEEACVYHIASEGIHGRWPCLQGGLCCHWRHPVLKGCHPGEVYWLLQSQGWDVAAADASDPIDSGVPFAHRPPCLPQFLAGLLQLSPEEHHGLRVPFTFEELEAAVSQATHKNASGLVGLTYEFYHATLPIIGPHFLSALNSMLSSGLLSVSLRCGVVRLLSKASKMPTVVELQRITLLSVEYKILTKMLETRPFHVLLSVLYATHDLLHPGVPSSTGWRQSCPRLSTCIAALCRGFCLA